MKNYIYKYRRELTEYELRDLLKKTFPKIYNDFNSVEVDEKCQDILDDYDIFTQEVVNVTPFFVRLSLPFAVIVVIIMLIFKPIFFMFTGKWYFDEIKTKWIYNWLDMFS